MLIKMRESKGFTLVELMIVVAIIGILAAVAVPFYQKYINKARLTSVVFPGVHSIQTNIASFYSFRNVIPATAATIITMMADADTACFGTPTVSAASSLVITVRSTGATRCGGLSRISGASTGRLMFQPVVRTNKVVSWCVGSTTLASSLGLAGEGC